MTTAPPVQTRPTPRRAERAGTIPADGDGGDGGGDDDSVPPAARSCSRFAFAFVIVDDGTPAFSPSSSGPAPTFPIRALSSPLSLALADALSESISIRGASPPAPPSALSISRINLA